ncbi:MAG: RIP metalloprotease RseP [Anaerolineae bacterium]
MVTTIVSFVFVLGILIFVHELGHFLVAKRVRIKVEEFGFGYPPRLFTIAKIGETEYTLNALLPLGGFVRVVDDGDPNQPGSFASKGKLARASFLAAGPTMNMLLAVALFGAMFMAGVPRPAEGVGAGIYWVEPGSPAAQAGLQVGDTVLQVDDFPIQDPNDLKEYISDKVGQEISLTVRRRGKTLPTPLKLTPRVNPPEGQGAMGVQFGPPLETISYPWWQAIAMGFRHTLTLLATMLVGLVQILRGMMVPEVAGPIGIAQITGEIAKSGLVNLMEFIAVLSVNLAIINLLPFPALDGGRLVFVILEALRGGRKIDPQKEKLVHIIGMAIILSLMLLISYFDLLRLFSGQSLLPR